MSFFLSSPADVVLAFRLAIFSSISFYTLLCPNLFLNSVFCSISGTARADRAQRVDCSRSNTLQCKGTFPKEVSKLKLHFASMQPRRSENPRIMCLSWNLVFSKGVSSRTACSCHRSHGGSSDPHRKCLSMNCCFASMKPSRSKGPHNKCLAWNGKSAKRRLAQNCPSSMARHCHARRDHTRTCTPSNSARW